MLPGGAYTDWFILTGASFDNDRVTHFEDGVDLIVFLASTGVTQFSDITDMRQAGSDVVIETSAGIIGLVNTDAADITEDDFLFGWRVPASCGGTFTALPANPRTC